jgi:PAS domain-containing protein
MADESKPVVPIATRAELLVILVKRLCLAESIGRIYSVNHPKSKAAIQEAYNALAAELEARPELLLSLTEGRIMVNGQPVEDRNPIVLRFVNAFQQVGVDNLVFTSGLTLAELEGFFGIVFQGAKVINAQGGLPAMLKAKGFEHVAVQEVTFVAIRSGEKVVARDTQPLDEPRQREPESADKTVEVIPFPTPMKPARPRRPRAPRVRKPVLNVITESLQTQGLVGDTGGALALQLGALFERELGARTRELKRENERLVDELRQLNRVLDQLDLSVVVWDANGVVTFVHHAAVTMLGLVAGRPLSPAVFQCLATLDFPLAGPTELRQEGLTERDAILLRAVERIIEGPDGQPIAALLRRG